jgi:hypothetical protein
VPRSRVHADGQGHKQQLKQIGKGGCRISHRAEDMNGNRRRHGTQELVTSPNRKAERPLGDPRIRGTKASPDLYRHRHLKRVKGGPFSW